MRCKYLGSRLFDWEMDGRKGRAVHLYVEREFPQGQTGEVHGSMAALYKLPAAFESPVRALTAGDYLNLDIDIGIGDKPVIVGVSKVAKGG